MRAEVMISEFVGEAGPVALAMKGKIEELTVDRMDQNQKIVTRYLNDPQFQDIAFRLAVRRLNDEIRGTKSEAVSE